MKVLCINNGPLKNSVGLIKVTPELKEGQLHTVTNQTEEAYELYEIKTPYGYSGYNRARFIPCSDIDEMELQEQKELSIAKLFTWL